VAKETNSQSAETSTPKPSSVDPVQVTDVDGTKPTKYKRKKTSTSQVPADLEVAARGRSIVKKFLDDQAKIEATRGKKPTVEIPAKPSKLGPAAMTPGNLQLAADGSQKGVPSKESFNIFLLSKTQIPSPKRANPRRRQ
jgi:hypothetical protein